MDPNIVTNRTIKNNTNKIFGNNARSRFEVTKTIRVIAAILPMNWDSVAANIELMFAREQ